MKITRLLTALMTPTIFALGAHADFHDHLGLQQWSLRDNTKAHGLPSSFDLAKGWGFTEIEGGVGGSDLTAEQVRAELDKRGLTAPSVHAGYELLTKDLPGVIRDAKALGASYVICPWIPHEGAFDAARMHSAADDFNRWGAALRTAGLKFGYHPHGYEFVPNGKPGETLLDDLIRATKPEDVCYEMDVFWTFHGGGDPVKLLEKYSSRWFALHVKDIRKGAPHGQPTGHAPPADNVAVGAGQLDWPAVLRAAEKIGVTYYFIEDETPTPMECIPESLTYLRGLKL